jgi:formate/nitrite transporter FocA (FNT family)
VVSAIEPSYWFVVNIHFEYQLISFNLGIVTFGNLAGSLFFAAVLVKCGSFFNMSIMYPKTYGQIKDSGIISTEPYMSYARNFAHKKAIDPAWHQIFLRGIGCNWLVSIAVWQAAGARDTISKVISIWIPIWVSACTCVILRHYLPHITFTPGQIFVACAFDHGVYILSALLIQSLILI